MRRILVALCFGVIVQAMSFSQTVRHPFTGGNDGADPLADLLLDSSNGLVLGTTDKGGSACPSPGCGTVFQISSGGTGYQTDYRFAGTPDGANPQAGLVADPSGNLYGTTYNGGTFNLGTIFKLTPLVGGGFSETVLYSFAGGNGDGKHPLSRLAIDANNALYGTTFQGGSKNKGVVFKLTGGVESILYNFTGGNGSQPRAGVVFDLSGNLWGTTAAGGAGFGTVFRLTENLGVWNESFLYPFAGPPSDFANPYAEVILDSSGDVYGTAKFGGPGCGALFPSGCGGVFELAGGGFSESLVYSFTGGPDGAESIADLTLATDASGFEYLFGTANKGGTLGNPCPSAGCGTLFELCSFGSSCGGAGAWNEYTVVDFAGKSNGRNPAANVLVFSPFALHDDPFNRPPGHGGCPSGCMTTLSVGGASGDGTIDTSP